MKYIKTIFLLSTLAILMQNCSLVEFTDVDNPNVTEEDFLKQNQSPEQMLKGLERQLAITLNRTVEMGEILSDNYFNNRTLSSKVFDKLVVLSSDQDVRYMQQQIHALRELALLGIEKVLPQHEDVSNDLKAEYYFFKGMSELFAGEYFTYLPASVNGEVLSSEENLNLAIDDFNTAIAESSDPAKINAYRLAKLRAMYNLGEDENIISFADQLISADNSFLRNAVYDGINGLNNSMQFFLFDSDNDEFAPLPSLDFLDPKYYNNGSPTTEQQSIAYLKIEEAYLIKAEAQLAGSQITQAKTTLKDLLVVVDNRPKVMIDDSRETRSGGNRESFFSPERGSYPLTDDYVVSFEGDAKEYSGLILDRQTGMIETYPVSGTSVTEADIDAAISEDEVLYLIYKLRQEVFIAEGRRVIDLGIKLQVADFEAISNDYVQAIHQEVQFPSFIQNLNLDQYPLDNFVNDTDAKKITIDYDFTKMIVQNKTATEVVPFF